MELLRNNHYFLIPFLFHQIILLNLLPVAHTVAKPNRDEKIILILIKDNPHGSRKMRVVPEIFWEEETPRRR